MTHQQSHQSNNHPAKDGRALDVIGNYRVNRIWNKLFIEMPAYRGERSGIIIIFIDFIIYAMKCYYCRYYYFLFLL